MIAATIVQWVSSLAGFLPPELLFTVAGVLNGFPFLYLLFVGLHCLFWILECHTEVKPIIIILFLVPVSIYGRRTFQQAEGFKIVDDTPPQPSQKLVNALWKVKAIIYSLQHFSSFAFKGGGVRKAIKI